MLRRTDEGQLNGANLTLGKNNSWRITGLGYSRNDGWCTRTCEGRADLVGDGGVKSEILVHDGSWGQKRTGGNLVDIHIYM